MTVSGRLIYVATRQILSSDSVTTAVPGIAPTTVEPSHNTQQVVSHLELGVTTRIVSAMVMRMLPVTVVSRQGDSVVLS